MTTSDLVYYPTRLLREDCRSQQVEGIFRLSKKVMGIIALNRERFPPLLILNLSQHPTLDEIPTMKMLMAASINYYPFPLLLIPFHTSTLVSLPSILLYSLLTCPFLYHLPSLPSPFFLVSCWFLTGA